MLNFPKKKTDEATLEEKQEKNNGNNSLPTPQQDRVSQEEMELLKETLRTYIFDEYMGSLMMFMQRELIGLRIFMRI